MMDRRRQRIAAVTLTMALAGLCGVAFCADGENKSNVDAQATSEPVADEQLATRPVSRGDEVEFQILSKRDESDGNGLVRTLVALAIVVALIFTARFFLRRFGVAGRGHNLSDTIDVVARTRVSPRQQLLLVRLGERLILVGNGPEGMSRLAEITDPSEVANLLKTAEQSKAVSLGNLIKRKPDEEKNTTPPDDKGGQL